MVSNDSEYDLVPHDPTRKVIRGESSLQASTAGTNLLQIQLEAVAKMVSRRAGELSQERGYKTVRKKDIKDAYEEFLKPQSVLMEASDDLGKWQDKMVKHAENTPLYLPEDE